MGSTTGAGQQTALAAFEGLFQKTLKADGEFRRELRVAGYDMDAPKAFYPSEVWNRCIDVALRHVTPGKKREEALRALGKVLIDGFFQTIVGSVISVGLPMLGAERVVQRLPRYITSTSLGVKMTVEKMGERRYLLRSIDAYALPELTAGLIEAGLLRTKTAGTATVGERPPDAYAVEVRW